MTKYYRITSSYKEQDGTKSEEVYIKVEGDEITILSCIPRGGNGTLTQRIEKIREEEIE